MGNRLFKEVTDLTGLPEELISEELASMLGKIGSTPSQVEMEDLRRAMIAYLTEVFGPERPEGSESEETPSMREFCH